MLPSQGPQSEAGAFPSDQDRATVAPGAGKNAPASGKTSALICRSGIVSSYFVLGADFRPPYFVAPETRNGKFAMDLSTYLLNGVVDATAPPHETEADARSRGDAIVEMVCAFDPRDAMETMIACHCVMLQILLNAAMRDASNVNLEPAVMIKARSGAISISRTLHQWVTQFGKARKRNETAVDAREAMEKPATKAGTPVAEPARIQSPPLKSVDAPGASPRAPVSPPAEMASTPVTVSNPGTSHVARLPDGFLPAVANGLPANGQANGAGVTGADRRRVA